MAADATVVTLDSKPSNTNTAVGVAVTFEVCLFLFSQLGRHHGTMIYGRRVTLHRMLVMHSPSGASVAAKF